MHPDDALAVLLHAAVPVLLESPERGLGGYLG